MDKLEMANKRLLRMDIADMLDNLMWGETPSSTTRIKVVLVRRTNAQIDKVYVHGIGKYEGWSGYLLKDAYTWVCNISKGDDVIVL